MEDLIELIELTSNRVYALRERLQETLRQDFPSETPQLLGKLLSQLVDKVRDELDQLCGELDDASSSRRRTLSRYVRLHACTIRLLAPYIRYVEGARLEHNPWHIVGQFERLCRWIVPRARVIIRPMWKYNYSSCWLNGELQDQVLLPMYETKPIFDRFPNFFALSYTSAESEDVLQYAIWGHEIGHLFSQELDARAPEVEKRFSREISKSAPFDPAEIDELVNFRLRRRLGLEPGEISEQERERLNELMVLQLTNIRNRWLSEVFADLFAIRLFGPASLLAFAALPLTDDELSQAGPSHPAPRLRLAEMLKQLETLGYTDLFGDEKIVSERASTGEIESQVKVRWKTWIERIERIAEQKPDPPERNQRLSGNPEIEEWRLQERLLKSNLEKAIPLVVERVNREIQDGYFCTADGMRDVFRQVELLYHHMPPEVSGDDVHCLGLILTAGWLYWNTYGRIKVATGGSHEELFEGRKRTNRLLSKGIESATVQAEFEERKKYASRREAARPILEEPSVPVDDARGGVLAAPDLLARMNEPDLERKLCVTPLLEQDQLQADSIDLRLGNAFLVTRRTTFPVIDVTAGEDEFRERLEQYQRRIYVPMGRPFYIHPGQFVLASSLEFLSMPRDLVGSLLGRTSWGRLGISVPTTSKVGPGFKGCLTIEIRNSGEAPVPLYPGVRIGQLTIQTLSREAPTYTGRYDVLTSTEFSRIYEDAEMEFLREFRPPLVIGVTGLSKSGRSRVVNYLREQGFRFSCHYQSLLALREDFAEYDMILRKPTGSVDEERELFSELRKSRGNDFFAQLLLETLNALGLSKAVVEGVERPEEVELLRSRTRFFLIGIEAPFERRLKWWAEDYEQEPKTEEQLRELDRWEYFGIPVGDTAPLGGAPNVDACLKRADYQIVNNRDKAYIHDQLLQILDNITDVQNLYANPF